MSDPRPVATFGTCQLCQHDGVVYRGEFNVSGYINWHALCSLCARQWRDRYENPIYRTSEAEASK